MARDEFLVGPQWLEDHVDDPDLRVFDVTVHLEPGPKGLKINSGRGDYESQHIPGAGFLDLASQLADPQSALDFTRPSIAQLAEVLSAAGVSNSDRVVVYSASSAMWATRFWWLLRASGALRVAVLDGGLARWIGDGRPVSDEPCAYPAGDFEAAPRGDLWASQDEVLASIGNGSVCTLNALPGAMYRGEVGLGYRRPGRIAGSANAAFSGLIDPDSGFFLNDAQLRRHFDAVGAFDKKRVINYCGGGISATMNAFALALLGHPDVAVYDGSLDEWARDENLPMETGE